LGECRRRSLYLLGCSATTGRLASVCCPIDDDPVLFVWSVHGHLNQEAVTQVNHEIYIFGSVMRGEVSLTSDVDVLVIPDGPQRRDSYPDSWSVYSAEIIKSYHRAGRLFAWHLQMEAKCVYSPTKDNLLDRLGRPAPYTTYWEDINDLEALMNEALAEIRKERIA
jgi:hypothetical protein